MRNLSESEVLSLRELLQLETNVLAKTKAVQMTETENENISLCISSQTDSKNSGTK